MEKHAISVRLKGDFALFTRPEFKIERVTYPVPTPSAMRGCIEAIYWHPQFDVRVREIHVLSPVKTLTLVRNEVKNKATLDRGERGYFADLDRTQRSSVILRDVDYAVYADVCARRGFDNEDPRKFIDIFARRVETGQCFHRPYLGCREFAAEFLPWHQLDAERPNWTEDLGIMLWDIDYSAGRQPYMPLWYRARVRRGIVAVPDTPLSGGGPS